MSEAKTRTASVPRAGLALVAFGAPWCVPWTLLQPVLDELAEQVPVVRVDVHEDTATAEMYRVVSLPTFVVVRDGRERRRFTGAVGAADLRRGLGLKRGR
jgi:thioredoxin 1